MPTAARRLHAYAASFGDELARTLITQNTSPGDLIVDPFVGGGTTVTQARLLGRSVIGIDTDPVACQVSQILGSQFTQVELAALEDEIQRALDVMKPALEACDLAGWPAGHSRQVGHLVVKIPNRPEVETWFAPSQRAVLALAIALADSLSEKSRILLRLAISSSIIRKWPNTISLAMDIDHSRPHKVSRSDISIEKDLGILTRVVGSLFGVLKRCNQEGQHSKVQILRGESASVLTSLPVDYVDYVLTSPPYFNAIDYPRSHKFSQWWLWPDEPDLKHSQYIGLRGGGLKDSIIEECSELIPGIIDSLQPLYKTHPAIFKSLCRYVCDLDNVITGIQGVLKPAGQATLVLGNNVVRKVDVPVIDIVQELFNRKGFARLRTLARPLNSSRRRYPYGLTGFKGLMQTEYIMHAVKG